MSDAFYAQPAFYHAVLGAALAALGSAPLGVFLVLRRMSLMGDVMAHAILPGVAAAFILAGMSVPLMGLGGLAAGLTVAVLAGVVTRVTAVREDAALAGFYLMAVAAGVLMIAAHGGAQDLEDILFGDARAIDGQALGGMAVVAGTTLAALTAIYRPLVVESFDPVFLRAVGGRGALVHAVFIGLTVINMVAGYRALGTLMAAGLMLLPAIAAPFWTQRLLPMLGLSVGVAVAVAGPIIVLLLGGFYLISLLFGRFGSVRARYFPFRHLEM